MSLIVQLKSLGAPERLEVTARLLLDLREQLHPVLQPVKIQGRSHGGRHSGSAAPAAYLWHVTMYSLHENPACECAAAVWAGRGERCMLASAVEKGTCSINRQQS